MIVPHFFTEKSFSMEQYLDYFLDSAEKETAEFLRTQVRDPEDLQYGGMRQDILNPKLTIFMTATAISVYYCEKSRYYHSEKLLGAIQLALDFAGRTQNSDGTYDFAVCNFKSAVDTSFNFQPLLLGYRLVKKYGGEREETPVLLGKYRTMLHKAAEGIRDGGFHTPNHRWAISAALMQSANLFSEETEFAESLENRAQEYLAERIDIDEDGMYAERSTGNYNAVVNNALLSLYQETGDRQYLDDVVRNLKMMLYYLDPDHTIFTQNSTRQDQGKLEYLDKYFMQYLYAVCETDDPVLDAAAHQILKDSQARGALAPEGGPYLMLFDALREHTFTHCGFPETYRKDFHTAGVLRMQNKKYAYTVLKGKSSFLFFKCGSYQFYLKIGEAVCEKRYFTPDTMQVTEHGCILSETFQSWYYQPFGEYQGTADWWKMDNTKRKKIHPDTIRTTLVITEEEDGLSFTVKTEGLTGMPLRILFCVPGDAVLENEHIFLRAKPGESMILKDSMLTVRTPGHEFEIGPGFGEHSFPGHYSGEEKDDYSFTVFFNAYTPFEKQFKIGIKN